MTAKPKKKLALSTQIFIALILAIGAGVALTGNPDIAKNYIKPFGTIFLNLIKWIVCPLVFFSIMAGVISMKDIKKVGIIGGTTVLFYLCTTAFAVAIGLLFANLLKGVFPVLSTANLSYDASASSVNFMDTLVGIFPSNFVKPFVDANMLQIIVMSLIIGFALIMISPRVNKEFHFVNTCNDMCMKAMEMILRFSPIGVFCLLCPVVAENGPAVLGSLAMVLLVAYLCYFVHAIVVYSLAVKAMGGLSPQSSSRGCCRP
jgi:Na+/H+-dicarboxylate symporter